MAQADRKSKKRKEKKKNALRLFLGIYPPIEVVEALLERMRGLEMMPPYREVPPGQVHLTLHFIGDTEPRNVDQVRESIDRAKKGLHAFTLIPEALVSFPRPDERAKQRGRPQSPRLIAARTNAPADLLELRRRVVRRLSIKPRKDPNDRFTPHMTLCRFRSFRREEYPLDDIDWAARGVAIDDGQDLAFDVTSFSLMKSTLRREGAAHQHLGDWPLTPGDA